MEAKQWLAEHGAEHGYNKKMGACLNGQHNPREIKNSFGGHQLLFGELHVKETKL
ncbi:hypothetical protein [Candidatus Coxiella mudrowiae]|uniref:hypothetical protein n=1 Tax=Candidatus Coxiella mudrowiae TaxID=2054173 RepID=UPI0012FEEA9E|nr:hypothetical protein [Candidatus Coxiella mudrowiae]